MTNLDTIVTERSTPEYESTILDQNKSAVPILDSLTLTLWDEATGNAINGRDKQNVLNANGGSFNSGVFTFVMTPLDTAIVDATKGTENRRITYDAIWNGGDGRKTHDVRFKVQNLKKID